MGIVTDVSGLSASVQRGPRVGQTIIRIDSRYFRPTEVDHLLGDATKARLKLGWEARISFDSLVKDMVDRDLFLAEKERIA